jgi:hypothetical protein
VPTPADLRKQFIKAFDHLAHDRERHDVLADFLEMAVCAIRKKTLPPGPAYCATIWMRQRGDLDETE